MPIDERSISELFMTRINLIHPSKLADQHLFAEWREIKHIPAFLQQLLSKGRNIEEIKSKIPDKFCLNKGHKYFFVDKMNFLHDRVWKIYEELKVRNFKLDTSPNDWEELTEGLDEEFFDNFYEPEVDALALSNERILERISQRSDWYRYKGEVKTVEFFKELMQ